MDDPHYIHYVPNLIRLDTVEPKVVEWLLPGRIPLGMLTMLAGDPKLGKSLVALDIATRVSTGDAWPAGIEQDQREPGDVILMSGEDHPNYTIRPRMDAMGADDKRIHLFNTVKDDM